MQNNVRNFRQNGNSVSRKTCKEVKSGFPILYAVEKFGSLLSKDKLKARGTHTPRLDFRRLPGPVFDPPRRETAGRVTR